MGDSWKLKSGRFRKEKINKEQNLNQHEGS